MAKKYRVDPKEIEAFKEAVKGVKPLRQNKVRLKANLAQTRPRTMHKKETALQITDPLYPTESVTGEEFIAYKQASIPNKTLRKLKKGQYNVEASLDLHGMTVEEARIAVSRFLLMATEESYRVVVVIHGKGKQDFPVLKNKLNQWLRSLDFVLAFCSASSLHGRHGAIYVLLKRSVQLE